MKKFNNLQGEGIMKRQAVVTNSKDNVATAVDDITAGTKVNVELEGAPFEITLKDDITFGHKFAIRDISKSEDVIKYGESIGGATENISEGQHVHIHNVESKRGRGDWEKGVEQ